MEMMSKSSVRLRNCPGMRGRAMSRSIKQENKTQQCLECAITWSKALHLWDSEGCFAYPKNAIKQG